MPCSCSSWLTTDAKTLKTTENHTYFSSLVSPCRCQTPPCMSPPKTATNSRLPIVIPLVFAAFLMQKMTRTPKIIYRFFFSLTDYKVYCIRGTQEVVQKHHFDEMINFEKLCNDFTAQRALPGIESRSSISWINRVPHKKNRPQPKALNLTHKIWETLTVPSHGFRPLQNLLLLISLGEVFTMKWNYGTGIYQPWHGLLYLYGRTWWCKS